MSEFYTTRPQLTRCESIIHDKNPNIRYIEHTVSTLAKYPQRGETGQQSYLFKENGLTDTQNKYFPNDNNNNRKLVEWYEKNFVFPKELIEEAQSLSTELMYILQSDNNPRIVRKQNKGKFDCSASNRTIKDIHLGRFSPDFTRPFKKRLKGQSSRPSIAIVVQGNPMFMWADAQNIPNVVRSALAIAWAAQALDCKVNAFLCQRFGSIIQGKEQHENIKFISSDDSITIHELGVMFHRDLVRWGRGCTRIHHPDIIKFRDSDDGDAQLHEPTKSVSFVKEFYDSDIVIAVGGHAEAKQADVHIPKALEPKKLVHTVAEILGKKLELKKAA